MTTNGNPRAAPSPAFGGTLGVIAIAFGIGVLGAYVFDWHGHQCDACSRKWWHLGAFNLGSESAHACPACGQVQWWKNGVPHAFRAAHAPLPAFSTRPLEIREIPRYTLPSGTFAAWPPR